MAALFLRRVITIYWNEISTSDKEISWYRVILLSGIVKSQLLEALKKEQFNLARRAICGVVSKLAAIELEAQRWPEILATMSMVRLRNRFLL